MITRTNQCVNRWRCHGITPRGHYIWTRDNCIRFGNIMRVSPLVHNYPFLDFLSLSEVPYVKTSMMEYLRLTIDPAVFRSNIWFYVRDSCGQTVHYNMETGQVTSSGEIIDTLIYPVLRVPFGSTFRPES